MELVVNFIFYYPLLMSLVWIVGSALFVLFRMDRQRTPPEIPGNPLVSILIPCHNEQEGIKETIREIMKQDYPNFEVIAINDASKDRTGEILTQLRERYPKLRVVDLETNQGKAVGLTLATLVSRGEYLVCIDADAILSTDAVRWLAWHFHWARVGAVTGNPRVRNRTSVLAKIQVGEFSSIIGMIKRTQRMLGKVFTVSGVVAAFRKKALLDVGFWSNNMVTEDIDISWKLQLAKWDIHYEPRALCWILVPEKVRGLFRQRVRWAQGGMEVLMKYALQILSWNNRRMWLLYLECLFSLVWCHAFLFTALLWAVGLVFSLPQAFVIRTVLPGWTGLIIATICLLQLCLGLVLDSRYDHRLKRTSAWLLWYPALYWIINCLVTVMAVPKAIFKERNAAAVWTSPDRGFGRTT